MSLWSRITNVFRTRNIERELDEELQAHIEEAIEHGRDPNEVRRAFGSILRTREQSRDLKLAPWLDSLKADITFGWRQLLKHRTASAAAILSLALAIGACTSAFRLIDAVLLRPMPVASPERLFFITYAYKDQNGKFDSGDSFEYPLFRELRAAVKQDAVLLAISYASRNDLTYGSDQDMEKAYTQYVSGEMFPSFGLKPALGRLLAPSDDLKPGAHPYAVLSYDYWQRRFGRDPKVLGRTVRLGRNSLEIIGVCAKGFTGTETGTLTDIFVPTMVNAEAINEAHWAWFRTLAQLKPGSEEEQVRQKLQASMSAYRRELAKGERNTARLNDYVNAPLSLNPAVSGVSRLQKDYRRPLQILGVIVFLVLLIACANVANLRMAQASARAREMAVRVSIGAGRGRLLQLVMVESVLIALIASALGGLIAWWSAPFVVSRISTADDPTRLILPADWRVAGFAMLLAISVTILFGAAPALRASSVKPVSALKGGDDPHSRRRLMHALVAAQVAFCFVVHFVAGLFVATFERMSNQPTGFSAERVLTLDTYAKGPQPDIAWAQLRDHLAAVPGVESVSYSRFALMSGSAWTSDVTVNGRREDTKFPYFLSVSPGWMETMKIPLLNGRDFRADDAQTSFAIVNEAFAKRYFDGQDPVGKVIEISQSKKQVPTPVIGYVADARYRDMRETIRPTIYTQLHSDKGLGSVTFAVRTRDRNPLRLAPVLRKEVPRSRADFRVSNIRTQSELVRQHTIRERLLAMLSLFFAGVALLLAAVGLYGVLNYSVLQRRREIGIRMALGARSRNVAWGVTADVFYMLLLGSVAGLAAGVGTEKYVETLLFQVHATDLTMLGLPLLTIFLAALLAALPPVLFALRIDPSVMLRAE